MPHSHDHPDHDPQGGRAQQVRGDGELLGVVATDALDVGLDANGALAAADHLVHNPGIDKVSFTGSTLAGKRIAQVCGERIARYTLELGGKSAAIIRDDFPTEAAAKLLTGTLTMMSGQVCAMLTRAIVPRARHDELAAAILRKRKLREVAAQRLPAVQPVPVHAADRHQWQGLGHDHLRPRRGDRATRSRPRHERAATAGAARRGALRAAARARRGLARWAHLPCGAGPALAVLAVAPGP